MGLWFEGVAVVAFNCARCYRVLGGADIILLGFDNFEHNFDSLVLLRRKIIKIYQP